MAAEREVMAQRVRAQDTERRKLHNTIQVLVVVVELLLYLSHDLLLVSF